MTALTSTERGRRFLAKKRQEREALIAAGLLEPKRRKRRARPPGANRNGTALTLIAADERRPGIPRRVTPPTMPEPLPRPGGRDAWPRAVAYGFSRDSGFLRPLSDAELVAWFAAREALRQPWPDTSDVDLAGLPEPPADWQPPNRLSASALALAALPRNRCRYGEGEPNEPAFKWCGKPCRPGEAYCPEHAAIASPGKPALRARPAPGATIAARPSGPRVWAAHGGAAEP